MNKRGVLYSLVLLVVALIVGAAGYGSIRAAGPPAPGAPGGGSPDGAGATTPGTAKGYDTTVDVGTGYAPLPGPPAIGTPRTITGTVTGALAAGDLTMPNRLNRDATPATCAAPKPFPGTIALTNYYDVYTYTNSSPDPQCVTASLTALTCNAQLSVYVDSFNPRDLSQNYLADPGLSTGAGGTVWTSFTVPAGHDFVVVVDDPNGTESGAPYTLAVGGFLLPDGATPTPTATPFPCGSQLPEPWATSTPQPPVRYRAGGTSDGTYVYVFGGGNAAAAYLNDLWRWNPATETWTGLTNMPTGKQNIQGVYYDGKIYVPGGYNGAHLTENAIYDLATNTWFTGSPLPAPQTGATAAYNGKIYVFGGNPGPQATTSIYDIASNTWFTGAAMPEPITYGRAVTAGNYAYYVGGIAGAGTTNAVYRYDFAANTWATMAPLQTARATAEVMASPDGTKIFAVMGGDSTYFTGVPLPVSVEIYDIAANTWTYGNPVVTKAAAPAGGLAGGKLMVQGGVDQTVYPNDVQVSPLAPACATPTITPSATSTVTPSVAPSATPGATVTACPLPFSDVHETDYFYAPVQYLYCRGVISGYGDNTFRPYNNTTRAQMVKIVVLGFGIPSTTPVGGGNTFADVPTSFPFFDVIETAAGNSVVSGYACGGPGEPCDAQSRPYFRPYRNVTRGQLSKIDVVAAGWDLLNPPNGSFTDVLPSTAFYTFVETAVCRGIISGYNCGGPGEPCDPQNRPYFRQGNDATRGQISKIVYLSILSPPGACAAPPAAKPAP